MEHKVYNEPLRSGKERGPPRKPGSTTALRLFRIAGHILQAFRLICREGYNGTKATRSLKASANYRSSAPANLSSLRLPLGSLLFISI